MEKPSLLVVADDEALRSQYALVLGDDFSLSYAERNATEAELKALPGIGDV